MEKARQELFDLNPKEKVLKEIDSRIASFHKKLAKLNALNKTKLAPMSEARVTEKVDPVLGNVSTIHLHHRETNVSKACEAEIPSEKTSPEDRQAILAALNGKESDGRPFQPVGDKQRKTFSKKTVPSHTASAEASKPLAKPNNPPQNQNSSKAALPTPQSNASSSVVLEKPAPLWPNSKVSLFGKATAVIGSKAPIHSTNTSVPLENNIAARKPSSPHVLGDSSKTNATKAAGLMQHEGAVGEEVLTPAPQALNRPDPSKERPVLIDGQVKSNDEQNKANPMPGVSVQNSSVKRVQWADVPLKETKEPHVSPLKSKPQSAKESKPILKVTAILARKSKVDSSDLKKPLHVGQSPKDNPVNKEDVGAALRQILKIPTASSKSPSAPQSRNPEMPPQPYYPMPQLSGRMEDFEKVRISFLNEIDAFLYLQISSLQRLQDPSFLSCSIRNPKCQFQPQSEGLEVLSDSCANLVLSVKKLQDQQQSTTRAASIDESTSESQRGTIRKLTASLYHASLKAQQLEFETRNKGSSYPIDSLIRPFEQTEIVLLYERYHELYQDVRKLRLAAQDCADTSTDRFQEQEISFLNHIVHDIKSRVQAIKSTHKSYNADVCLLENTLKAINDELIPFKKMPAPKSIPSTCYRFPQQLGLSAQSIFNQKVPHGNPQNLVKSNQPQGNSMSS